MEDQQITLAREAYQRYGAVTDFKNFRNEPMPEWHELPATIQRAWAAAANPPVYDEDQANEYASIIVSALNAIPCKDNAGRMLCAHYGSDALKRRFAELSSAVNQ